MRENHDELQRLASEIDWIWKRDKWMSIPKIDRRMELFAESIVDRENSLRKSFGNEYFHDAMAESMTDEIQSSWAIEGIGLDSYAIRSLVVGALNIDIPEWKLGVDPFKREEAAVKATLTMFNSNEKLTIGRLLEVHSMLENCQEKNVLWGKFRSCGVYVRDCDSDSIVYVAPPADRVDSLMDEYIA